MQDQEQLFNDVDYLYDQADRRAVIRYLLEAYRGMTLAGLAKKHGLSQVTLNYSISGKRRRRNPHCMAAVSRELGVLTRDLFPPRNDNGKQET